MVAIENLKLNELQQVDVPHARDLMKSVGLREPNPMQYSGDETVDTALRKTEGAQAALTQARREAEAAEAQEE